jgi:hypothetical protein
MTAKPYFLLSLLTLSLPGLVGCQSANQPGSASHASVQIKGHSLAEIQQAATAVFGEAGYARTLGGEANEMVFERPGSRRDALKWGGWEGKGVTMRVKVWFTQSVPGTYLLQADAYAIDNADTSFPTERRNLLLNRRPYQKLLDDVAKRLKSLPSAQS